MIVSAICIGNLQSRMFLVSSNVEFVFVGPKINFKVMENNLLDISVYASHNGKELCEILLSLSLLEKPGMRLSLSTEVVVYELGARNIKCWRSKGGRCHLWKYSQFLPPRPPPPPVVSICSNQTFCHANQWLVAALWSAALNSFSLIN